MSLFLTLAVCSEIGKCAALSLSQVCHYLRSFFARAAFHREQMFQTLVEKEEF